MAQGVAHAMGEFLVAGNKRKLPARLDACLLLYREGKDVFVGRISCDIEKNDAHSCGIA
jgi:hypothetical protein